MSKEERDEILTDQIANRIKSGRDISKWQNNNFHKSLADLLVKLSSLPKSNLPIPDLMTIKNKVLDRISVPAELAEERAGWFFSLPQILRIAAGSVGTLLILVSLSAGVAVAALQSSPGETIYPLKKIVENVELNLTHDPNKKADLQIEFANNRLDELSEIIAKNKAGEINQQEAQKIVAQTVTALQKTTSAAAATSSSQKKVSTLNKLVDLSNKQEAVLQPLLSAATVADEGEVKIIVEQALETSTATKEQAIKNITDSGATPDQTDSTASADTNKITATGKITSITHNTISIGSSKFILTDETVYNGNQKLDLKADVPVTIVGKVNEKDQTVASSITTITPNDAENPASVDQDDKNDDTEATSTSDNNSFDINTQTDTQSIPDSTSSGQ